MQPTTVKRKPAFYYGYIRSNDWKRVRTERLEMADWHCERCKVRRATCVHHIDYANLGHEPPEDLMALCWHCHNEVHSWPVPANDNRQLNLLFEEAA